MKRTVSIILILVLLLTLCSCKANRYEKLLEEAMTFSDEGSGNEAIAACTEAIELMPENYEAYGARGNLFKANGQLDEAIADYDAAIGNSGDAAYYNEAKAEVYYEKKDYEQSITAAQLAIKAGGDEEALKSKISDWAHEWAGELNNNEEYEKANQVLLDYYDEVVTVEGSCFLFWEYGKYADIYNYYFSDSYKDSIIDAQRYVTGYKPYGIEFTEPIKLSDELGGETVAYTECRINDSKGECVDFHNPEVHTYRGYFSDLGLPSGEWITDMWYHFSEKQDYSECYGSAYSSIDAYVLCFSPYQFTILEIVD